MISAPLWNSHLTARALLSWLSVMLAAAALMAQPVSAQSQATPGSADIVDALREAGHKAEQNGRHIVVGTKGEQSVRMRIFIGGVDHDLSYIAFFSGSFDAAKINRFNQQVKFGRIWIDDDGDMCLQLDRNAAGGVTMANILADIDVFAVLANKLKSDFGL